MPKPIVPYGYCHCGCGGLAPIAKETRRSRGYQQGEPVRFIRGHAGWQGGINQTGPYVRIHSKGIPSPNKRYVMEHIKLVEAVLGRPLPAQAVVHHIDGNGQNNRNDNLVVCEDQAYHLLLHQRQRALSACGHANWRFCTFCKRYDSSDNLIFYKHGNEAWLLATHKQCQVNYSRQKYQRQKEKR